MSGVWNLTITHAASTHNTTHTRLKHVPCYSMTAPAWRVTGAVELPSSVEDKTGQPEGRRRGICTAGMNTSRSALLAQRLSTAHIERPSLSRRSVPAYVVVVCVHKMMTPCAVVIRDPFNTPKMSAYNSKPET